jgi:hypothetical protein
MPLQPSFSLLDDQVRYKKQPTADDNDHLEHFSLTLILAARAGNKSSKLKNIQR